MHNLFSNTNNNNTGIKANQKRKIKDITVLQAPIIAFDY